jgi:WD40 repeat protein/tetratricopeptide (TPR) repeat protein
MPIENVRPVILLTFANDRSDGSRYLRNLPEESRRVRAALQAAERAGLCEVVDCPNATAGEIIDALQDARYHGRVAVFHYGGHSDGYRLLLESASGRPEAAHAGGLARLLGQQHGLRLVFLNGCSTGPQVQGLLAARVPAVVATSRSIVDSAATDFAARFYAELGAGGSPQRAFAVAQSAVEMVRGGATRDLLRELEAGEAVDLPWSLHQGEGQEMALDWTLAEAVGDPTFGLPPLPEQDLPDSPFRHLFSFAEKQADVFFGRGYQIRDLYERVTAPNAAPIILLYGQSGVGKSSLLAAGLLPRLKTGHEVRYVLRYPQKGLLNSIELPPLFEGRRLRLGDSLRAVEEQCGKPLLLIMDQLEKVFTNPVPERPRELLELVEVLQEAFADPEQRPRSKLILGFRKEWLSEVEHRFAEAGLPRAKVFLKRLDRRGVIEAVIGPARSARLLRQYVLTVEEGLAEAIADDLLQDNESAVAPTLQILLTKMWERAIQRERGKPRFDLELYLQLKSEGLLLRDFLRQQLAALHGWRAGVVDSGLALDLLSYHTTALGTAAERTKEDLEGAYGHVGDVIGPLVQQCKDLYLLADPAEDQADPAETTRLAHDTLAPLVREQFDNSDKPGQRARRILANRAGEWEGGQVEPLDEVDLELVEKGESGTRAFTRGEQRLVHASRAKRDKRERSRSLWRILGLAAVVAIATFAVIAWIQRERAQVANSQLSQALQDEKKARGGEQAAREQAERRSWVSDARRLATQSASVRERYPERSVLLATEAIRATTDHGEPPVPAAETALHLALQNIGGRPLVSRHGEVSDFVISPDSAWVVAGGSAGFDLWPLPGKEVAGVPSPLKGASQLPQFSADGKRLLSITEEGRVCLWELRAAEGPIGPIIPAHRSTGVVSARFSPDGHWVLATLPDGSLQLWDVHALASETPSHLVHGRIDGAWFQGLDERPPALRVYPSDDFSRDGRWLFYSGFDGAARLLRLDRGATGWKPLLLTGVVTNFRDHSAAGDWLLTEGIDGRTDLWDLRAEDILASARTLDEFGTASKFLFDPTGRWLFVGMKDGRSYLWDLSSRRIPARPCNLPGIAPDRYGEDNLFSPVRDQFSPDGAYLMTRIAGDSARLWKLTGAQPPILAGTLELGQADYFDFSPDGRWLMTMQKTQKSPLSSPDRLSLWDLHQNTPLETPIPLTGAGDRVGVASFSPDSRWLVYEDSRREIHLRHLDGNDPSSSHAIPRTYELNSLLPLFSPEGRWLVTEMQDSLALWDLSAAAPTGAPNRLRAHVGRFGKRWFSNDGAWLVTASDELGFRLWDLTAPDHSFSPLALPKPLNSDEYRAPMPVSPDGKRMAVPQADGSVLIYNLNKDDPRASAVRIPGDARLISALSFSPDARWLVIDSGNGTPRLVRTLPTIGPAVPVAIPGEKQQVRGSAFAPDSGHLLTAGEQSAIHLWKLEPDQTLFHKRVLNGHQGRIDNLSVSPDSRWLVSQGTEIGNDLVVKEQTTVLWRLAAGWLSPVRIPYEAQSIAFSRNGKWLSICVFGRVLLWDITGSEPRQVGSEQSGQLRTMRTVRFSANSRWLVAEPSFHSSYLWDLSAQNIEGSVIVLEDQSNHFCSTGFSPDSRWMLVTSDDWRRAFLIDLTARDVVKSASLLSGLSTVPLPAFSSDHHWLAAGDHRGRVLLWNLMSTTPTESYLVLERERELAGTLRFNHDNLRLLIGKEKLDSSLRGFVDGQPLEESVGLGRPTSENAQFVHSGTREWLLSVDADAVRLWPVDTPGLVRIAALAVSRNLTQEEWSQYEFKKVYRRTVPTRPADPALVRKGQELARKGDITGATAAFGQAVEQDPSLDLHPERTARELAAKTLLTMGDQAAITGRIAEAVKRYQAAQDADPELHVAPEQRARSIRAGVLVAEAKRGRWQDRGAEPINRLREAWELQTALRMNNPELGRKLASLARGIELASHGDVENASQAFREALDPALIQDLEPAGYARRLTVAGLLSRADRHAIAGELEAAADEYRRAQRLEPSLRFDPQKKSKLVAAQHLVELGNFLLTNSKFLEALAKYRSAFALDPDAPAAATALNRAARELCLSGHATTDALFASEKAVALDPDNGAVRDTRGLAKALTGRFAEAIQDFEAFIAWSKDEKAKQHRRAWRDALRSGRNPFTPSLLRSLR